jgi:Kef-type K+ transport system membrane component KefB
MKYAGPASLIAIGGVLIPFACGVYGTIWFGFADSFSDPKALFMGAILTATSVGITARVLSDIKHLDSAEGVTILAAAVLDDVLGILVLTIVVGISESGEVSLSDVALVGGKAVGFWIALTGIGILLSKYISIFLDSFRVPGAAIALALSLALLAAGLAESFGLAMIIGAYSMGLSLSGTKIAHRLEEPMRAVYNAFVPIFFVVMGMLVDIPAMKGVLVFGAVITGLAVMSKIIGSGVPALMTGFTKWGSWRVGIGMLPRGEVALIIAGIGLSRGIVGADLFGVSIMMTVITTLIAPIILVPAFKNNIEGRRSSTKE